MVGKIFGGIVVVLLILVLIYSVAKYIYFQDAVFIGTYSEDGDPFAKDTISVYMSNTDIDTQGVRILWREFVIPTKGMSMEDIINYANLARKNDIRPGVRVRRVYVMREKYWSTSLPLHLPFWKFGIHIDSYSPASKEAHYEFGTSGLVYVLAEIGPIKWLTKVA